MNILRFMIPKSLSVYIRDDSTVRQGTEKMRYHRYVAIPILDSEGKYVGTLRNDDVLNYFIENKNLTRRDLEKTPVMAVADTSCKPLSHDASFESLFEGTKRLPWEEWIGKTDAFPVKGHAIKSRLYSIPDCQSIVKKAIVERLKAK